MRLGLGGVGEEAGGLDDDLGAYAGPVELGRVALGEDLDFFAVDGDEVLTVADFVLEVSENGVVLEQVGQGGRGGEVVYGYEFDFRIVEGGAEDVASDAAEAVDTNLYCHDCDCSCQSDAPVGALITMPDVRFNYYRAQRNRIRPIRMKSYYRSPVGANRSKVMNVKGAVKGAGDLRRA